MIIITMAALLFIRIHHEIRLQSIQATSRHADGNKSTKKKPKKVTKTEFSEGEND